MPTDARRFAPSTARNKGPILEVVRRHLPSCGRVLEIASGTGEHAVHFASNLSPDLIFQPSDPSAEARESIEAWVRYANLPNLKPPLELDVCAKPWPIEAAIASGGDEQRPVAVISINMIHIAPWAAAIALFEGAARVIAPSSMLILYGPFRRDGAHTAPSNEAFDADLKSRNPEWGIRDLEAVAQLAAAQGFAAPHIEPMPANNLTVIFARQSAARS